MREKLDELRYMISGAGKHARMAFTVGALLFLVFIFSTLTTNLMTSYHDKMETEEKIATMQAFIEEWTEKNEKLNRSSMRPVEAKQLDMVQTDVIFKLQAFNLNIISLKEKSETKTENGKLYVVEFEGPYDKTIQFLKDFKVRDALIGIQHLSMEPKNGLIKSKVTYKIYTK